MKAPMLCLCIQAFANACRICLACSLLAWPTPLFSNEPPCLVVNGPTGDPALTQANFDWTKRLIQNLESRNIHCKVLNIDHWARANKMFRDGTADVLFPEIVGDPEQPGVTGRPIALTHGFVIFTRHKTGPLNHIDELAGLNVGTIRGRYYPEELRNISGIQIEPGNSLEQNMHKLALGRIDATIEYQSDGVKLLNRLGLRAMIHHGAEFGVQELAYRFHQSDQGMRLRHHFDEAAQELIDNGTYHQLFTGTTQRMVTD
ncbi:hypothetical protein EHN06_14225 [Marinobacter sp. NP-4(2019)]|uniref:substrate-binding periplasmic protein n=1 Tax=Marinobacter sp. NP-4(2019) TaxID=2488665 RepID=UPI000FC3EC40|nr:transporter substrate-binding domain-containing protein [Marinobacter sp. NP-4(2019)]AZT84607.1 hypothetical protein EHN06_14225 [Marinobacter sp. NP-4(2019)]